ncbi:2-succinyl-5-enolpyruvyl-6-hydroxy-3-cyclohexene-1-carboxylate synthase [Crinalium epipsammum PCC 9333]|uniref:2-succinyl-5-enolpyruvyl-6-hydroxy-3-cyclohexene-1-carboxylate synthase n=1 Tax=Crinalium epipsammum PCC 9333 TaxID=1173022 RepID=K9W4K1_9CYAN|nr:2-succinyl-5-enolpyruvyl-6-hydroxy-3-cyclohexene-1-carboxylic-acid synthase [Crinalium epipsammum]AFZ14672.1 2-succinyl-5-enolpyruvyl-6-hydroxy-3-cyclohexene-1-carboxylate synthase [Crinalium epipsammum PCC 9333]
MSIDFRNTNSVWASILATTLQRLGLTTAVICPGSRSTPLAVAFAQHPQIEAIPVLDERSASFFALGIAKRTHRPVVLVCTSGTAGANFYPAIIEAKESRIPLIVLTADRPPEMRDCHSGQTIDQVKLYGNYPNWQTELAVPSLDIKLLRYLRQTIMYAWERSHFPTPGVVHLNIPFRDPLAPIPELEAEVFKSQLQPEEFFAGITPYIQTQTSSIPNLETIIEKWLQCERGIIIAGVAQPIQPEEYCSAIAHLSKLLKFPVLAEGLSPVRNYAQLNPYLISTYDLILRNQQLAQQLTPEIVIQIGDLPTSKELRTWLESLQPEQWIIDPSHHNLDSLHNQTHHLRISVEQLSFVAQKYLLSKQSQYNRLNEIPNSSYIDLWCNSEASVRSSIDQTMISMQELFEGKLAWLLSQTLPQKTPIFISNSMPVRDVEFFWKPNNSEIQPFFNRGANGIDGTLSTALGIAHRHQSSIMLTGDLALLHDTNGFLLRNKFFGSITIILINNNGGGIFEMLPIFKFDPPFEEFFATPQNINFADLCTTYNVDYELITSWEHLQQLLNPLPTTGIRVLELRTNRTTDANWRKNNLSKFALTISSLK